MKKNTIVKWLIADLIIIAVAVIYYLFLYLINSTCIVKSIAGKECLTCGMTRAIVCLVRGDFVGYISYNYLALPTFVIVYCSVHFVNSKVKIIVNTFAIIITIALVVRYIIIKV